VIPTVFLDPATAFLAGTLIAIASRRQIALHGEGASDRAVLFGTAYGLWYGLGVGYFFFVYPDWMLGYVQDGAQLYKPLAYVFFLLVLGGSGAAGAATCAGFLRRGQGNRAVGVGATGLLALISIWRLMWHQYWTVGTFEEFWKGIAKPLVEVPAFQKAVNVSGSLTAVPFLALVGWLVWSGRKLQPPASKA
jgi:hypothetical protein